jgi:hypothetical protein
LEGSKRRFVGHSVCRICLSASVRYRRDIMFWHQCSSVPVRRRGPVSARHHYPSKAVCIIYGKPRLRAAVKGDSCAKLVLTTSYKLCIPISSLDLLLNYSTRPFLSPIFQRFIHSQSWIRYCLRAYRGRHPSQSDLLQSLGSPLQSLLILNSSNILSESPGLDFCFEHLVQLCGRSTYNCQ